MSNNALARLANSVPIRWGYFTKNRLAQKVIFIGHEKAIYDADGTRLDSKLSSIEDSISDAFSEGKDYVVGDYCIYLNALYKFTAAKPAGAWDGSKVVPVSVSQEIANLNAKTNNFMILSAGQTEPYFQESKTAGTQETKTIVVENKGQKSIVPLVSMLVLGATSSVASVRVNPLSLTEFNLTMMLNENIEGNVSIHLLYVVIGVF